MINNVEHKKLFSKCYYAYVIQCILKGKDVNEFELRFNGKYLQGFLIRFKDWCEYILNNIYRLYLVHITPKDDKTFKKYELIHYRVKMSIHPKVSNVPDEFILRAYLKENGFLIIDEQIIGSTTIYKIAKI